MTTKNNEEEWALVEGGGSFSEFSLEEVVRLFGGTLDFLMKLDAQGCITYINRIFAQHAPVKNVLGMRASVFLAESSMIVFESAVKRSVEEQKTQVFEAELGLGAWFLCRLSPIFREGNFCGHILMATDLSDTKKARAELEIANALLEARVDRSDLSLAKELARSEQLEERLVESQRLECLGALAGGVAHEYNNLLTVVLGNAGLAQMLLPEGSPAREAIQHLETATVHAAELTNQLLTFSGNMRFKPETLSLSVAIAELATLMEANLKGGKTLELSCREGVPLVLGDLGQIQQVLMHLVRHASDRLGPGTGIIRIETGEALLDHEKIKGCYLTDGIVGGQYAYLKVSHQGPTLSKKQRHHFFEPFSPYAPSVHGLGIAAALGIVRSYGGTAQVSSVRRETDVTFFFPALEAENVPVGHGDRRPLLLLVDEELSDEDDLGGLLTYLGCELRRVDSAQAAIEFLDEDGVCASAVILTSSHFGLNAVDCFDAIHDTNPQIPIVLMSGFSEEAIQNAFEARPLHAVLKKPVRFPDLERIVRKTIGSA